MWLITTNKPHPKSYDQHLMWPSAILFCLIQNHIVKLFSVLLANQSKDVFIRYAIIAFRFCPRAESEGQASFRMWLNCLPQSFCWSRKRIHNLPTWFHCGYLKGQVYCSHEWDFILGPILDSIPLGEGEEHFQRVEICFICVYLLLAH